MKIKMTAILLALIASASVAVNIHAQKHTHAHAATQNDKSHADCPMRQGDKSEAAANARGHESHHNASDARGEKAMGFSQTATTHHFLLARDGGVIQVEVNDPNDAQNRDLIRQHLAHISRMFAAGDFRTPMLVHELTPPGVPVLERLKAEITYAFEETGAGARVRIKTSNAEALSAVHEFLRFQIREHQTGDPLEADSQ
jgi:hypothetical protein